MCQFLFAQLNEALSDRVTAINAEFRPGDVPGCVTQEEDHGAHEVFGCSHLANRDERSPLVAQVGVVIQDLACTASQISDYLRQQQKKNKISVTYRAVNMYPGLIQFTRISCPAHSTAKDDAR